MRRSLVSPTNVSAKINLIPLIDVCLVLVVILLITAPTLKVRDMGILLPEAQSRGDADELRISVTLGRQGEIAVDEEVISRETLVRTLGRRIAETDEDVLVVVRADAGTPYEEVAQVIREARGAGAKRLAIAAQPAGRPFLPEGLETLRAERIFP